MDSGKGDLAYREESASYKLGWVQSKEAIKKRADFSHKKRVSPA